MWVCYVCSLLLALNSHWDVMSRYTGSHCWGVGLSVCQPAACTRCCWQLKITGTKSAGGLLLAYQLTLLGCGFVMCVSLLLALLAFYYVKFYLYGAAAGTCQAAGFCVHWTPFPSATLPAAAVHKRTL